jgi:hypothetical protein
LAKGQKILDSTDGKIKGPPSVWLLEVALPGFLALLCI